MKSQLSLLFAFAGITLGNMATVAQEAIFEPPISADDYNRFFNQGDAINTQESAMPFDNETVEYFLDSKCFGTQNVNEIACQYGLNSSFTVSRTDIFASNIFYEDTLASYQINLRPQTQFRVRSNVSSNDSGAIFEVLDSF